MAAPPRASSDTATAGRWFSSKVALASISWSPVTTTCRRSGTVRVEPSGRRSGTLCAPGELAAMASSSTRRISRVAVRPRICLARATSCTPGSCTTTRSAPCCWITGSATPSSLMRLCRVPMFCLSALAWMSRVAFGLSATSSRRSSPLPSSRTSRSRLKSRITPSARLRVSSSRNRTSTSLPARLIPACRRFFSRSSVRSSPVSASMRLSTACRMSTCIRKCTPPRRSRPRYMGAARRAASHCGVRGTRFSATTKLGSAASRLSARSTTSLALSWVSVSAKRARTVKLFCPVASMLTP